MGHYEYLARLLEYPDERYQDALAQCRQLLTADEPEAAPHLEEFAHGIAPLGTEQLQELFTRTFDLNAVCVLEVGWQLYGDEYKRGEFLARMRGELAAHQIPESRELADHLTQVLRLLSRLEPEDASQFATLFAMPAVAKMLASLRGKKNPYEELLSAIQVVLSRWQSPVGPSIDGSGDRGVGGEA